MRGLSGARDRHAYLTADEGRLTLLELVVPPVSGLPARGRPQAAAAGFGNRLRLERERRRITLASIAANTKIGLSLLQGFERDDVSRWPSGIFRRSFIRAYAEAVGLDADEIAREFLEHFPDKAEAPRVAPPSSTPGWARTTSRDPVLRLALGDPAAAFTSRRVLQAMLRRAAAAAWDVGGLMAIGLTLFRTLHQFWMPLAIATLGYFVAG